MKFKKSQARNCSPLVTGTVTKGIIMIQMETRKIPPGHCKSLQFPSLLHHLHRDRRRSDKPDQFVDLGSF